MKKHLRKLRKQRKQLESFVDNVQADFDEMTKDEFNAKFELLDGTTGVQFDAEELIIYIDLILDNS